MSNEYKIFRNLKIDIYGLFAEKIKMCSLKNYKNISLDLKSLKSFQIFYLNLSKGLEDKLLILQNEHLPDEVVDYFFDHISGFYLSGIFLKDCYKCMKKLNYEQRQYVYKQINTFIIPKIDECFDIISYTKKKGAFKIDSILNILWDTLEI